jgi:hypothetical protein
VAVGWNSITNYIDVETARSTQNTYKFKLELLVEFVDQSAVTSRACSTANLEQIGSTYMSSIEILRDTETRENTPTIPEKH